MSTSSRDPVELLHWSVQDVVEWLSELRLSQDYSMVFKGMPFLFMTAFLYIYKIISLSARLEREREKKRMVNVMSVVILSLRCFSGWINELFVFFRV